MRYRFFLSLLFMLSAVCAVAQQETATEVVQKADEKFRGESSKASIKMEIIRPEWQRTMELRTWSLGRDYNMVLVEAPAKDKGTVSLKRKNELWNWLPAIERSIKISPSMMMQSWMGSDFTNDDLLRESSVVYDYTHSFEGSATLEGRECHVILLTPKPDAPVVWGKIRTWISKEDYLQLKTEYYDEDGYLVNLLEQDQVKEMDGRLIPTRLSMRPVEEEGHRTVMTYQQIAFDVDLSESFFSLQNMRRIR